MRWAILVPPSLENTIGKVTIAQKPSSRVSGSTPIQFYSLVFSPLVHIPDTPSFDSLFSAYNSQIDISSPNLLQALETEPIQNPHSVFLCLSLLSLRIPPRCPDVADCWLTYHPQIYSPRFLFAHAAGAETTCHSCVWPGD